jgi:hypothetical protein
MLLMVIIGICVWLFNLIAFRTQWFRFRTQLKNRRLELGQVLSTPLVLFGLMIFTFGHFYIVLSAFDYLKLQEIFFKYVFLFSLITPLSFIFYLGRHLPENYPADNSFSLAWVSIWPLWCSLFGITLIIKNTLSMQALQEDLVSSVLAVLSQFIPLIIFYSINRHLSVKTDTKSDSKL